MLYQNLTHNYYYYYYIIIIITKIYIAHYRIAPNALTVSIRSSE